MEEKLLACKSIVNITASLMYITGGNSIFNNCSAVYLNGAHDYTVSWIDQQVLNEDLPRTLLKVLSLGLQDWIVDNIPMKNKRTFDVFTENEVPDIDKTIVQQFSQGINSRNIQDNDYPWKQLDADEPPINIL
jgi:hypothetical protein